MGSHGLFRPGPYMLMDSCPSDRAFLPPIVGALFWRNAVHGFTWFIIQIWSDSLCTDKQKKSSMNLHKNHPVGGVINHPSDGISVIRHLSPLRQLVFKPLQSSEHFFPCAYRTLLRAIATSVAHTGYTATVHVNRN